MKESVRYSTTQRRRHISLNAKRFNLGLKTQWTYRDIAFDIAKTFDRKAPSPATIKNDLDILSRTGTPLSVNEEGTRLLEPENFPEWRKEAFKAPNGKVYETPKHQMAWFHLVATLALKVKLPEWVITYLRIEDLNVNDWAEVQERLLSLFLLAPPRHGKSDLLMHAMVWLICRNPDIRIIWCGGKLEISALVTTWVRNELEANEWLIENYGPFESENDWGASKFSVATRTVRTRMPTMMAVGKNTTILSLDADFIVVDDFVDLKASESATQTMKDVRWLTSQLFSRREPWTPLFGIGSHQPSPIGDVYVVLNANEDNEIVIVKQKAHDYVYCLPLEDGMEEEDRHGEHCMLWPSVRPFWFLEAQRKTLGDVLYEVCYNQDIRQAKIEYFREAVIHGEYPEPVLDDDGNFELPLLDDDIGVLDRGRSFGTTPKCCTKILTVVGFDPAASERRDASESALFVYGGCPVCGRRYLIDYWHKRQSPEKHPATILQYQDIYKVPVIRIENNAYQKALSKDRALTRQASLRGFIVEGERTGTEKHDSSMGIPILSRHMENGLFSVPYMLPQDRDKAQHFLAQLIRWPAKPNDCVMALWIAEGALLRRLDDARSNTPEFYGDIDDLPDYLLEEIYEVDMSVQGINGF